MFFGSAEAQNSTTDFTPEMFSVLGMCTSGRIDKILSDLLAGARILLMTESHMHASNQTLWLCLAKSNF